MTRLQRLLCLALGVLAIGSLVAARLVHAQAEAGRAALAQADRAHLEWFDARVAETAARAAASSSTAAVAPVDAPSSDRRLLAAIEGARHAQRPTVRAKPRVVVRVRTVMLSQVAR